MDSLMILSHLLAQIETGVAWLDPLLQSILSDYGAIVLLVVVVLIFTAITQYNSSKRADENERFVLDTAKEAKETKDELIKLKDEYHAFKLTSASEKGVQDGRIIELSDTVKRQQEKFDEREKALQREIDRLTKESQDNKEKLEKLQVELAGKDKAIEALTSERDSQKATIADLERDKLDKELEIERMKGLILEQENAIKALKQELDSMKAAATTQPSATNVTPVTPEINENQK